MTRIRSFGAVGIVCVLITLMVFLGGMGGARGDELADLRANQQLLQQKIDQLALGAPLGVPPPGAASLSGSFPRSFLIPGTDTSLLIGGYVNLDTAYYIQGGNNQNNYSSPPGTGVAAAAGEPLNLHGTGVFAPAFFNGSARQNGWFRMDADESRLRVETRTPTAWGQASTVWEIDFQGCTAGTPDCSAINRSTNGVLPRLRLAYGTVGGFIAGQGWVPGNDLEASPELFDFYGDAGQFGYARVPQIGYKFALPWAAGVSLGLYATLPTGELATPVGGIESDDQALTNTVLSALAIDPLKDSVPDGWLVLNFQQPWGHLQFHGAIRDSSLSDGHFISQSFVGYGGGVSGEVHPGWFGWTKDRIGFNAWAADGLGHDEGNWTGTNTNSTQELISNFGGPGMYGSVGGPTTLPAAKLIRFETVPAWGGEVNYQHWWLPNLRSNVTFGIAEQQLNKALLGPATAANFQYNRELYTAHINLIWSPVAFINTGFEYTFDHRNTIWNVPGQGQILDYTFQVKF